MQAKKFDVTAAGDSAAGERQPLHILIASLYLLQCPLYKTNEPNANSFLYSGGTIAGIGAVRSRYLGPVQISGTAAPIDESFTTSPLDPQIWQISAQDPAGVIPVTPDALFWLSWTVPDVGYKLQSAPGVSGQWADLALTVPQLGNRKRAVVNASDLPVGGSGNYFFRLGK